MGTDEIVFGVVLLLRLGIPLLIPRMPLPAIITCLIIDGIDQTIFQKLTDADLSWYQSYDKALDVYYLTIAYISTLRNWPFGTWFHVSMFLWYYRLVGVVAFELTQVRALLLIFPNTFEYFFIFYEAIRLLWDPARMPRKRIIMSAAAIWIFIKLPQEWWIHIAQLDVTDTIRDYPWVVPLVIVVALIGLAIAWPFLKRLPPPERKISFAGMRQGVGARAKEHEARSMQLVRSTLVEKAILVSLVSIIFAQVLPGTDVSNFWLIVAVGIVVVANGLFSHWLAKRGTHWFSSLTEFLVMAGVNLVILMVYLVIARRIDGSFDVPAALFFVLLLTLIVTLFDRYHQLRMERTEVPA